MNERDSIVHESSYRVYYEDTDSGGVVYHANYLKFMERARTDWLIAEGFAPHLIARNPGIIFIVTHAELSFRHPAKLGDLLRVTVECTDTRPASLWIQQSIFCNDVELATGNLRIACINVKTHQISRMPQEFKEVLNKWNQ